jgi:hypothetical protein
MVDAVLGQDHQRSIRPQATVEQRLAHAIGCARGLLIGEVPPSARWHALREKHAVGLGHRPPLEQDAEAAWHGTKPPCRSQHGRSVRKPLKRDLGGGK